MKLLHHFHDGSSRPQWAGAVTHVGRQKSSAATSTTTELGGVVVPVCVAGKYLPAAGRGHTFGLGLGFPDLSQHFLASSGNSHLAQRWKQMEDAVTGAALKTMGWKVKPYPHQLSGIGLPAHVLHLRLVPGLHRRKGDREEEAGAEPDIVTGEISKLFPIFDASGTRMRMERISSPSSFRLTPHHCSWSKHPSGL